MRYFDYAVFFLAALCSAFFVTAVPKKNWHRNAKTLFKWLVPFAVFAILSLAFVATGERIEDKAARWLFCWGDLFDSCRKDRDIQRELATKQTTELALWLDARTETQRQNWKTAEDRYRDIIRYYDTLPAEEKTSQNTVTRLGTAHLSLGRIYTELKDKDAACLHLYNSREYFVLAKDLQQARTSDRVLELQGCIIASNAATKDQSSSGHKGNGSADSNQDIITLRERAAKGDTNAMTSLGHNYFSGTNTPKDFLIARKWFKEGADGGDVTAMNNLAFMYDQGLGGSRNINAALDLYQKASALGSDSAMWNLANAYEEGKYIARDETLAAYYLLSAYRKGNELAKLRLRGGLPTWSTTTRAAVQEKLKREGYYRGATTGTFDDATYQALDLYAVQP